MTAPLKIMKPKVKRKISWETFEKKYLSQEDGFKYEWLNGTIEKTPYMNKTQLFILGNLQDFFMNLKVNKKAIGQLIAEADLFFKEHHRRPDICWLTDEQIDKMADNENEVPAFVIEVISPSDKIEYVESKMDDYRAAEVQVVWRIFPHQKAVHIYTGKQLKNSIVHTEEMLCSAAPALPNFEIPTHEIFKRKQAQAK